MSASGTTATNATELQKKNAKTLLIPSHPKALIHALCLWIGWGKRLFFYSSSHLIRWSFSFERRDRRAQKKIHSYGKLKAVLVKIVSRTTYQKGEERKKKNEFLLRVIKFRRKKKNNKKNVVHLIDLIRKLCTPLESIDWKPVGHSFSIWVYILFSWSESLFMKYVKCMCV